MATATVWDKTKTGGKKGFDKVYSLVDKLGPPVNKLSNKLGAEAFWPTTLDKESDKAARILRSFCKDGFYQEEERQSADGPKLKQKVVKKIPAEVIAKAKGLAIFTTMRTGLWFSGAGGSGILVGRKADGSWSPPSGIMLHTAGLGFLAGADIYDCVVVINSQAALDAFSKIRCTLGGEISAVAGPVGAGGVLDSEVHKRQAPIFTYLKSRGLYAGVQVDGTVVIERTDENERFYGQKVSVAGILKGEVNHVPYETKMLMNTIRAAQGERVADSMLPQEAAPADHEIEKEETLFGVPDADDPDPFGVKALETAGLEIREAGTRSRPSRESFEYRPSPTSPVFAAFHRKSISGASFHHQRNKSSIDRGVQTDDLPDSPRKARSHNGDGFGRHGSISEEHVETFDSGSTKSTNYEAPIGLGLRNEGEEFRRHGSIPEEHVEKFVNNSNEGTNHISSNGIGLHNEDDHEDENELEHEHEHSHVEAEVQTISYGAIHSPTRVVTGAKMVTIPKRVPPRLPPRNPARKQSMDNDEEGSIAGTTLAEAASPVALPTEENMWDDVHLEGAPLSPSRSPRAADVETSRNHSTQHWTRNGETSPSRRHIITERPNHPNIDVPLDSTSKEDAFYSSPTSPAHESSPGLPMEKATALA